MKKASIFAIVFLSVAVQSAMAQGKPAWISNVETAIKQKEPTLKMGGHLTDENPSSYSESFKLNQGRLTGSVEITIYKILSNPDETFSGRVTVYDNLLRSKKSKLTGIGDEAYMWAGNNADDYATVFFRKGKTFISVFLPGKATAQRVAKLVASQIP
jgi:hypothetical protein